MMDDATTPTWMSNPLFAFGLKDYKSPTPSPTTIESNIAIASETGTVETAAPALAAASKPVVKIPDLQVDKRVTPVTPAINNDIEALKLTKSSGALFTDSKMGENKKERGRPSLSSNEALTSLCNGAVCMSKANAEKNGNMSPTAIERKFLRQSIASAEVYKTSMPQEMSKSLLQHMEELNNMRVEAFQRYRDTADPVEAQRWGRQYQEISEQILEAQMELCDSSKAVVDFVRENSGKQSAEDEDSTSKKQPKIGNMAPGPVKHLIMQGVPDSGKVQDNEQDETTADTTTSSSSCGDTTTSTEDDVDDFECNGLSPTALERRILRESRCFDEVTQEPLRNGVVHTTALRNGMVCGLEFTHSLSPTAMERKILRNSMSMNDVYQSTKPPRMSAEFMDGVEELNKKVAKDSALRSIEQLSQKRKQAFNKFRESLGADGEAVEQSLRDYRDISAEIAGKRRSLLESSLPPALKLRRSLSRSSPSVAREPQVPEEPDTAASDYLRLDAPPKGKAAHSTPNKGRPSGLEAALKTPNKTPIRTPNLKPPSGAKNNNSAVKQKQLFSTPKTLATPGHGKSAEKGLDVTDAPTHVSSLQVVDTSHLWQPDEPSKIIPNASVTFLADPNASATFLADPLAAMEKEKDVVESLHPATHTLALKDIAFKDVVFAADEEPAPEKEEPVCIGKAFATPKLVQTPSKLPALDASEEEVEEEAPSHVSGLQASAMASVAPAEEESLAPAPSVEEEEEDPAAKRQSVAGAAAVDKQHIVLKPVPSGKDRSSTDDKMELPRNKLGETADGPVNLERQSMHESPKHASTFNFFDMLSFFKKQLGFEAQQKADAEAELQAEAAPKKRPSMKKSWEPQPCSATEAPPAAAPVPQSSAAAIKVAKDAIKDVLADSDPLPQSMPPSPAAETGDSPRTAEMTEPEAQHEPVTVAKEEAVAAGSDEGDVQPAAEPMEPEAKEPEPEEAAEAAPAKEALSRAIEPKAAATPSKVKGMASSFGASSIATPSKVRENAPQPGSASRVRDMASTFTKKDADAAKSGVRALPHCDAEDPAMNPAATFGMTLRSTPKKEPKQRAGQEEIRLNNMSEKVRAVATSFKMKQMQAEESESTPSKPPLGRGTPLKATPSRCGSGGNEETRLTNMSAKVREAATTFREKAFAASNGTPFKDPSKSSTATPIKVKDMMAAFNNSTPQPAAAPSPKTTPVVMKLKPVHADVQEQSKQAESSPATTPKVVKTKPVSAAVAAAEPPTENTPSKVKDFVKKVQEEGQGSRTATPSKVKAFVSKVEKVPGGSAAGTPSKVKDFAATFAAKIDEQKDSTPHKSVIAASPFKKFEQKQAKALTPAKRAVDSDSEGADPSDPRTRQKEWKRADVFAGVQDAASAFRERDAAEQAAAEQAAQPAKKARATFQDKIKRAASQVDRAQTAAHRTPEKAANGVRAPASTSKLPVRAALDDKENMANSPTAPRSASKAVGGWSRDKALTAAKKKEMDKGWFAQGEGGEDEELRREALAETEKALEEGAEDAEVGKAKAWLAQNRAEHERVPPGLGIGFRV